MAVLLFTPCFARPYEACVGDNSRQKRAGREGRCVRTPKQRSRDLFLVRLVDRGRSRERYLNISTDDKRFCLDGSSGVDSIIDRRAA